MVPLSGGLSFRCSRQHGAVLAIPNEALSQDVLNRRIYKNYIIENCERWLAFSELRGLELRMEDIVLVTGCDLTTNWAVAAFTNHETDASIQLQMGSSFQGLGLGTHISWKNERNVERNWGPREVFGASIHLPGPPVAMSSTHISELPSVMDDSYQDQCVFVRGYRVKLRGRLLPKKLMAAAEPINLEGGTYGNFGELLSAYENTEEDDECERDQYDGEVYSVVSSSVI